MSGHPTLLLTGLWIVAIFQGLVVVALVRQLQELQEQLKAQPVVHSLSMVGSLAPQFHTTDERSGDPLTVHDLLGTGGVLLFLSSQCKACGRLAEDIVKQGRIDRLVVMWFGQPNEAFIQLRQHVRVGVAEVSRIGVAYQIKAFPTAVILNGEGIIAGYIHPNSFEQIAEILKNTVSTSADRTANSSDRPEVLASRSPMLNEASADV